MRRNRDPNSWALGEYDLPNEGKVIGTLRVRGPSTHVEVHADHPIAQQATYDCILGKSYSGDHVTLIDCHRAETSIRTAGRAARRFSANLDPMFVVDGTRHLDPKNECIKSICFSTTDLRTLFHDLRAFGTIHDSSGSLERVLKERGEERPIELGPYPTIAYFTGRNRIVEAATPLGTFSVNHSLSYGFGGPAGVHLKNSMYVELEPQRPLVFADAISTLKDIALFLSAAAGRKQGIRRIHLVLPPADGEEHPTLLRVRMSYGSGPGRPTRSLHHRDMPLDALAAPSEFQQVIDNWFSRHPTWHLARFRYLSCLRAANFYDADRITRAANMFDLLPEQGSTAPRALAPEFYAAKHACIALLRELPDGPDRNSALSALGRIGKPFLLTKVLQRIDVLEPSLGSHLPDIRWVAAIAVKCRNAFVHGRSKDFDIDAAERFVPFLTDALEFVFGASDFVEAGWDCGPWLRRGLSGGHRFSNFLRNYRARAAELREALVAGSGAPTAS